MGHNEIHQSFKCQGVAFLSDDDKMTEVGEATKIRYAVAIAIEACYHN